MLGAAWALSPGGWVDVEAVTSERLLVEDKSELYLLLANRFLIFAFPMILFAHFRKMYLEL